MTKARELAELGTTLSVDGSGNADLAGILTTDGLTVEAVSDALITVSDSSSANQKLDIKHNAGVSTLLSGNNGAYGTIRIDQFNGTTTRQSIFINPNNDISFYEDTGTTAKFFWDASAEALGIGTSSPVAPLHVYNSSPSLLPAASFYVNRNGGTPSSIQGFQIYNNVSGGFVDTTLVYGNTANSYLAFGHHNGTTYAERLRITSNGNVGIGTSSPSRTLSVDGVAGFGNGTIETIISYSDRGIFGTQSNHALELRTNGTERLRITSSGNVGIGTSSPTNKLTVAGGIDFSASAFSGSGTGIWSPLTNELGFVTAGSTRLRIDASGNVGIGTTSPAAKLDVLETYDTVANILANGTYAAKFTSNTFGDAGRAQGILLGGVNSYGRGAAILGEAQSTGNAHDMIFAVSSTGSTPTERMRIDSSGTLLVAKTSSGIGTVGHQIQFNGLAQHTANGSEVLQLNRLTSDGVIAQFRKDGTVVGSIGADNSQLVVTASSSNLVFENPTRTMSFSSGALAGAGASNDAVIDLGISNRRFKNLYLSGGVYLGGTGAANLLDDYEEGTWTPFLNGYTGVTYSSQLGWYEKIGRFVRASFRLDIASTGTFLSNSRISGLPFSSGTTDTPSQGCQPTLITALNATRSDQYLAIYNSGTDMFAYSSGGGAYNGNNWQAGLVTGVITYWTNS